MLLAPCVSILSPRLFLLSLPQPVICFFTGINILLFCVFVRFIVAERSIEVHTQNMNQLLFGTLCSICCSPIPYFCFCAGNERSQVREEKES